jgi:proteasome accessory factor B
MAGQHHSRCLSLGGAIESVFEGRLMSTKQQRETAERIVNLAMYLSAARAPVTWEDIRAEVAGYPDDQGREAFLRMFERDKKQLRESGLVIATDAEGRYLLDEAATYATEVQLDDDESAALRAAAAALVDDPSFPFSQDLQLAMAKLAPGSGHTPCATARMADEDPVRQGRDAALVAEAAQRCKRVTFAYTTSAGERADRVVEPYGAFVRDGRWYLVGRDVDRDALRTFSLSRIESLEVNEARQSTPDFERPADFDIAVHVMLPFQLGEEDFSAVIEFASDAAWRARALTAGQGHVADGDDGSIEWSVPARSKGRLIRWTIENGPGIRVLEPADIASEAVGLLEEVRREHS